MIATLPNTEPAVAYARRDLLAQYRQASPAQRRRGRAWYATARRACRAIADESGYSLAQVAAVMAITSPQIQLRTNVEVTRDICRGLRPSHAGMYPANQAPKVIAVLSSPYRPGRHVTGPKVSAFYRAIMGAADELVIDRWAAYAASGNRLGSLSDPWRRTFEQAYRDAASETGETMRAFQAIIWIVARESTPRARRGARRDPQLFETAQYERAPRLLDIDDVTEWSQ